MTRQTLPQGTPSVFNFGVTGYPDEIGRTRAAFFGLNQGTTTSGTVSDHPLQDGQVQVIVNFHTHNAPAFAQDANPPTTATLRPVLFGNTPDQPAANPGLTPPVGESNLKLVYNAAPGAPPPDIVNAFIWERTSSTRAGQEKSGSGRWVKIRARFSRPARLNPGNLNHGSKRKK
jgi:hypothetical protein